MKIEYVLVLKENKDEKIKNKPRIQSVLKKCFDNVGVNSFEIKYKRNTYIVQYKCATHKTDSKGRGSAVYYLTFSYGTSKNEITASILDYIHNCFVSKINLGEHKFHVTISYDERALYFCSKAYPHFIEFESKLRCLILKLLTQTFGALWAKKTLKEDHIKMVKEKMRNSNFEVITSEALYEMDIFTLESYLFEKTREVSPEDIVDNNLSPSLLKELDRDTICNILDSARPKSNWERYFADKIEIDQLEDKLKIIREERNKIAHIKHYSKKDFDEDKQILCGFIVKLDQAISSIEVASLTAKEGLGVITTFGSLVFGLLSMGLATKQAAEVSQAPIKVLSESIAKKLEANASTIKIASENISKIDISAFKAASESISKIDISAFKTATESISKIDMSAYKAISESISKIDTSAFKTASESISKIDMSALKVVQESLPKIDTSAYKAISESISKIDKSAYNVSQIINQRIDIPELQRIRTAVLNNEGNGNGNL